MKIQKIIIILLFVEIQWFHSCVTFEFDTVSKIWVKSTIVVIVVKYVSVGNSVSISHIHGVNQKRSCDNNQRGKYTTKTPFE